MPDDRLPAPIGFSMPAGLHFWSDAAAIFLTAGLALALISGAGAILRAFLAGS